MALSAGFKMLHSELCLPLASWERTFLSSWECYLSFQNKSGNAVHSSLAKAEMSV